MVGPVRLVKGLEKAPTRCLGCEHCWLSENRELILRADSEFIRPAESIVR